jgi:hypothetical protein
LPSGSIKMENLLLLLTNAAIDQPSYPEAL